MSICRRFVFWLLVGLAAMESRGWATDWSYELDSSYSFVGGARTDLSDFKNIRNGEVTEQNSRFHFVATPQLTDSVLLRLGGEWQRYSFGLPASAPIPNTLQSTSLVVGMDVQAFGSWLFRLEATPGFYSGSNHFDGRDFNVPFVLGGTYIAGPDLLWVLGVQVDINSRYPVLPGAGVRWKFAEKWVLNGIFPNPRLEYSLRKSLTLYTGVDLKMSSYRLDKNFGTIHNAKVLDGTYMDYTELRVGVGLSGKVYRSFTLELEGGYMPYRDFDYHNNSLNPQTINGAPYGQISLSSRF
ncbi:MAG: DUF6268 family outer membrane beta-barrel protein [Chthoniobacteraceae bacterium]